MQVLFKESFRCSTSNRRLFINMSDSKNSSFNFSASLYRHKTEYHTGTKVSVVQKERLRTFTTSEPLSASQGSISRTELLPASVWSTTVWQVKLLMRASSRYTFLGTFVMMGLGRVLKISFRLMSAFTEYEVESRWSVSMASSWLSWEWPECFMRTAKGLSSLTCFPYRMWCPTISTGTPWWRNNVWQPWQRVKHEPTQALCVEVIGVTGVQTHRFGLFLKLCPYLFGVHQVTHYVSSQTRVVSGYHLSLQLHQQPLGRTTTIHTASAGDTHQSYEGTPGIMSESFLTSL